MLGYKRTERLNDQIRMEIADILMTKVKDPRVGFVTVTSVEVSPDLRYAKVFVSILAALAPSEKTMEGLTKAAPFIRGELGRRLHIRYIPELTFQLDRSAEETDRVLKLLDKIAKIRQNESHEQ
ncbi:MAG TPA: 30S ribosome-binding factor RbfA [Nitrospiria bacterium]|nr:30S ribosome-binding factor RbfA [Nitrospiria bacterium]